MQRLSASPIRRLDQDAFFVRHAYFIGAPTWQNTHVIHRDGQQAIDTSLDRLSARAPMR
ncbi:MAG: hypothetical protein M3N29_03900 [Chloroflexota bacterium]|nr:hypothetical protein [Chloroflexota bacterium]